MDLELKGKRAVITGASRGIGLHILRSLAREGVDLAFCARNADDLAEAADELAGLGGRLWYESVDIRDGHAYRDWLVRAADELGGCDIFIPVASGGGGPGEAPWLRNLEIDLLGAVRGIEVLEAHLVEARGSVLLISSTAAVETFFFPQSYNALKAALITYGKQLSQALGTKGVRVNIVSPGSIEFPGGSWERHRSERPAFYDAVRQSIPSARLGTPNEVADVVTFLVSQRASWVTGCNVIVDGGQTKRVQF